MIELHKIEEEKFFNKYLKLYETNPDFGIFKFVKEIKKISALIFYYIEIHESVEADMQSVNGMRYHSVSSFESDFGASYLAGSDLTFEIQCEYICEDQYLSICIMVNEEAQRVSVVAPSADFELLDLLSKGK